MRIRARRLAHENGPGRNLACRIVQKTLLSFETGPKMMQDHSDTGMRLLLCTLGELPPVHTRLAIQEWNIWQPFLAFSFIAQSSCVGGIMLS
mmetsp:Transcript_29605/g.54613  ORF Transcript_29605/g.54613 Transcript_29605/m.54613 type:complete len:92 (+) Transcript_29605:579-854(+)